MSFWYKGTRASSCDSTDAAKPGVTVKREELADSYNVSHDRPGGAREWRGLLQVWTRQMTVRRQPGGCGLVENWVAGAHRVTRSS